jgi:hypothetical protein
VRGVCTGRFLHDIQVTGLVDLENHVYFNRLSSEIT